MNAKIVVFALAVAVLGLTGASHSEAQVTVGIGIHFNVPPPPPVRYEPVVQPPFRDAVWVNGFWSWDEYACRYVWVSGHWVARYPQPVYREVRYRHVPSGVAKGWWKKHGKESRGRMFIEREDD